METELNRLGAKALRSFSSTAVHLLDLNFLFRFFFFSYKIVLVEYRAKRPIFLLGYSWKFQTVSSNMNQIPLITFNIEKIKKYVHYFIASIRP